MTDDYLDTIRNVNAGLAGARQANSVMGFIGGLANRLGDKVKITNYDTDSQKILNDQTSMFDTDKSMFSDLSKNSIINPDMTTNLPSNISAKPQITSGSFDSEIRNISPSVNIPTQMGYGISNVKPIDFQSNISMNPKSYSLRDIYSSWRTGNPLT